MKNYCVCVCKCIDLCVGAARCISLNTCSVKFQKCDSKVYVGNVL